MDSGFAHAGLMGIGRNCIEGNGVHCLQTASFTFTGPLSPLPHHSGLCTEREREENTGNQSGCVGISHLLLYDTVPCLWPLEMILEP